MNETLLEASEKLEDLTLHIVLATMPQRQEGIFDKCVVDGFYGEYRKKFKDYLHGQKDGPYGYLPKHPDKPVLYNPIRYYILGNYDIAYISLIDNFKFAQRVFEPQLLVSKEEKPPELFAPHTFQSFSGISVPGETDLKKFFLKKLNPEFESRRFFLAITNLKLNNGFLIGNGSFFLEVVIKWINTTIFRYNKLNNHENQVEFLIMQSFSWFEISIVLFADNPKHISSILKLLRRSMIGNLIIDKKKVIDDSLYASLFKGEYTHEELEQAHVFADTQTYFGVHADLVDCPDDDPFLQKFKKTDTELKTEVEWQVKPGHMTYLLDFLESSAKHIYDWKERYLLAGKNDYYLRNKSIKLIDNIEMLRLIFKQTKDSELYNHVRKIRTRVQFDDGKVRKNDSRKIIDFHKKLVKNAVTIEEFSEIDRKLKSLKISRQIRSKILKIFANYNNGIQDIILFPYFLDFKLFIRYLKDYIHKMGDKLAHKFAQPNVYYPELNMGEIEDALMNLIRIFQEGYNIRMLNGYQFEDINDFDLDFNSSIQQLLSVYSSLAIEVGNGFYNKDYVYGPIIQLNLKDTVSNYVSINYYVHHLTSPEFVFATLTKEVINYLHIGDADMRSVIEGYEETLIRHSKGNDPITELIATYGVKIKYLLNDAIRFIITYENKFELFQYWFWTYNLQNTSLYDETGMMNEYHFRKELFRVTFLCCFFDHNTTKLTCPLPELYTFWDRHFENTLRSVKEFLDFMEKGHQCSVMMDYILKLLKRNMENATGPFKIDERMVAKGADFIVRVQNKYQKEFPDLMPLSARISKKIEIYELLESGDRQGHVPKDSAIYLQWFMIHSLETIFELNHKIILLRRNWKDGRPLQTFVRDADGSYLYAVDQTGGLFFDDQEAIKKYFRLSSAMLNTIWNYALKKKKDFIVQTMQHDHE